MRVPTEILSRKKNIETEDKVDKYFGATAPSISMVTKWFTEVCIGHTSTCDTECSGRPTEVDIPEEIEQIHDIVLINRRWIVRDLE